jgi:hypothetical protein
MSAIALDDFEIGVADEPTHMPVVDDEDRVIGHVDLRCSVSIEVAQTGVSGK